MDGPIPSDLRFNLGFLLEASLGTRREVELAYPRLRLAPDLILTPLAGELTLSRNSHGVYIAGTLESVALVECSRCLNDVSFAMKMALGDLFYYPPATAPAGDFAIGEDGYIDLAPLVRELSLLEIPMQVLCRPDCLGLCNNCGKNLNQSGCDCVVDDIDPRLAGLRQLLDP